MSFRKKIIIISAFLASFAALNFGYLWKQFSFVISPHSRVATPQETQNDYKLEPNTLIIERLGIKTPIIYVVENSEKEFQKALATGVVHYPGTAKIGEYGNAYIFGHSSDNLWSAGNYKTIFALLPKLKTGDEIIASDDEGIKFTYKVAETAVISPDDQRYLNMRYINKKVLTLQTSYPVGTSLKRFIIVAEAEKI